MMKLTRRCFQQIHRLRMYPLNLLQELHGIKVTLGRKVLVPGVGLEPTTLCTPVCCSNNWASRATDHRHCPIHFNTFTVNKIKIKIIWPPVVLTLFTSALNYFMSSLLNIMSFNRIYYCRLFFCFIVEEFR